MFCKFGITKWFTPQQGIAKSWQENPGNYKQALPQSVQGRECVGKGMETWKKRREKTRMRKCCGEEEGHLKTWEDNKDELHVVLFYVSPLLGPK